MLDDIDPTSDWVVETQEPKFGVDLDVELEDLQEVLLDADPLLLMTTVHTRIDPKIVGMEDTSRPRPRTCSRRGHQHSANTTTSLADDFDPKEPETEPDHDAFVSPSGSSSSSSSSSSSGVASVEFDDDH